MKEDRLPIIKQKALEIINKKRPKIDKIPDLFSIEDGECYHMVWDYPGKYYKQHLNIHTEGDFIKYIVRETTNDIYKK